MPTLSRLFACLLLLFAAQGAFAAPRGIEVHQRLLPVSGAPPRVALTLDACSGHYDADLIRFLVRRRIAATLFVTARWLERNPAGVADILAHPELFAVENHGERHIPAVIGAGRLVYGIPGEPDLAHLQREVLGGAEAIQRVFRLTPRWYRAATAQYDASAISAIESMGFRVAGFTLNADAGAVLPRKTVAERVRRASDGDIILAHMNRPASSAGEGLAEGLQALQEAGYQFVRLDSVDVQRVK